MTFTTIRVGNITIAGMRRQPAPAVLTRHLEAAIGAALAEPQGRTHAARAIPLRLPRLQIALPPTATQAEIASAVAAVLRNVTPGAR